MGTRYNIFDVVEHKNKSYIVAEILNPHSDSPDYVLRDSAAGKTRAKASNMEFIEHERKCPDSQFEIGDKVVHRNPTYAMKDHVEVEVQDIRKSDRLGDNFEYKIYHSEKTYWVQESNLEKLE